MVFKMTTTTLETLARGCQVASADGFQIKATEDSFDWLSEDASRKKKHLKASVPFGAPHGPGCGGRSPFVNGVDI